MNLYLVSQGANSGYDTYSGFVVVAPDAKTARHTYPSGAREWREGCWQSCNIHSGVWSPDDYYAWALPSEVKVTKIGTTHYKKIKVICSDFNAG